jgi:hypothetical protein
MLLPVLAFGAPVALHHLSRSIGANVSASAPVPEQPDAFKPPTMLIDAVEPNAVDLFGNEIAPAVTQFRVDAAGSEYEVHAPRVEIPRLAPPTS